MNLSKYGEVLAEVDLKKYNTYRVKAITKYMVMVNSIENLIDLIEYLKGNNIMYKIFGNGSNLIIKCDYYDGVIIKLDNLNEIEYFDNNEVKVSAGVMIPKISMDIINHNLKGLEWAVGIPGTIGGCIFNNAGAYNSSIFDFIKSVTYLDENLNIVTKNKEELYYGYRDSYFKQNKDSVILSCVLQMQDGNHDSSMNLIEDRKIRRMESQPLEYPSAGSVFRNPEDTYAGKLIEECNLKLYNINGATVSDKHANFIVNMGDATGKDIVELIEKIKKEVKNKFDIELILEQEIVG